MSLNEFVNKTASEMLDNHYDEESFSTILTEAVKRTVEECATRVADYSARRIPASEYQYLLRNSFK